MAQELFTEADAGHQLTDAERVEGTDVVAHMPAVGHTVRSGLIRHEDDVGPTTTCLPVPAMKALREVSRCPSRL
jgi:hypothetical protein